MEINRNGQGFLRKNLDGELAYWSFVPTPLQEVAATLDLGKDAVRLLSECSRKVGELEGVLGFLPNASMYLTMYVRKEALLSSQIEGTQCTFDDVLSPDAGELLRKDVADVVNYVKASDYAVRRMDELPLCTRLLREIHGILLSEGRGVDRQPGVLRTTQNWIGPQGCTLATAPYVPPNPEDMADALSDLEKFVNDPDCPVDPLVKAALVHYQFETVHPFLDGNGRLGRLLITLSIMNDRVLSGPYFYPSYRLKLRRREYYARLTAVRTEGDYRQWVSFFCECLLDAAQDALSSLRRLIGLHERDEGLVRARAGRSAANGERLLALLEGNPIVDVAFVAERLGVSRSTAAALVRTFEELGVLRLRDGSRKRYRQYQYEDYLSILREGGEPLG